MKRLLKVPLLWMGVLVMLGIVVIGFQWENLGSLSLGVFNETNGGGSVNGENERKAEGGAEKNSFIVILDPGHGGSETGRQAFGYDEKDLNNQLTEKIAKELKALGITVKFTRHYSQDDDMELFERVEIANDMEADLFLSIHHDGSIHTEASGVSVFYSTYRPMISMENAYIRNTVSGQVYNLIGEVRNSEGRKDYLYIDEEGEQVLADPDDETMEPFEEFPSEEALISEAFAGKLAKRLAETGLWNRGPIDAPYYVVRRSIHPAVLVEAGFMTNEEELQGIIDPLTQQIRANAIAEAVYEFLLDNLADN